MREDNSYSRNQVIGFYGCLACKRKKIFLEKQIVDKKDRMIALEPYGLQQYRCRLERAQGMQSLDSGGGQDNIIQDDVYFQRRCH